MIQTSFTVDVELSETTTFPIEVTVRRSEIEKAAKLLAAENPGYSIQTCRDAVLRWMVGQIETIANGVHTATFRSGGIETIGDCLTEAAGLAEIKTGTEGK